MSTRKRRTPPATSIPVVPRRVMTWIIPTAAESVDRVTECTVAGFLAAGQFDLARATAGDQDTAVDRWEHALDRWRLIRAARHLDSHHEMLCRR